MEVRRGAREGEEVVDEGLAVTLSVDRPEEGVRSGSYISRLDAWSVMSPW